MRLVIIESPYSPNGHLARWPRGLKWLGRIIELRANLRYLRRCMRDSLVQHGEAPYASHGLYTQPGVLDDTDKAERIYGMHAGFAWGRCAHAVAVYVDRGISDGMIHGIGKALKRGLPVEYRVLGGGHPDLEWLIEQAEMQARIYVP